MELWGCFASPLPFLPPAEAAGQLLKILGSQLRCDRVALLWRSGSEEVLHGVSWHRPDLLITGQLTSASRIEEQSELPEPFHNLSWRLLSGVSENELAPSVFLGTETREEQQNLPSAWEVFIPGILSWSMQFEQRLRDRTLTAMAEYAAGAGHEINNPLGSIIGRASQLLKSETNDERRRLLESIGAQAYRIRDMIGDTMLFANPPVSRPQSISMNEMIQNVLDQFGGQIADSQVKLHFVPSEPVFIPADPDQFHIVVSELVRNSLNALSENPPESLRELRICCTVRQQRGQNGGELELIDTGPGLTPQQQEHCFNPFYSGRQAGRGLGFGLSKCWQIVQQHQGTISLSCDQGTTRVLVWFPSSSPLHSAESS